MRRPLTGGPIKIPYESSAPEGELGHLSRLFGFADSHFQSWAYWQLKLFKDYVYYYVYYVNN